MSRLLTAFTAAVLFSMQALGKTVTGLFKTEVARQHQGQFITKFMYQGNTVVIYSDDVRISIYTPSSINVFLKGNLILYSQPLKFQTAGKEDTLKGFPCPV